MPRKLRRDVFRRREAPGGGGEGPASHQLELLESFNVAQGCARVVVAKPLEKDSSEASPLYFAGGWSANPLPYLGHIAQTYGREAFAVAYRPSRRDPGEYRVTVGAKQGIVTKHVARQIVESRAPIDELVSLRQLERRDAIAATLYRYSNGGKPDAIVQSYDVPLVLGSRCLGAVVLAYPASLMRRPSLKTVKAEMRDYARQQVSQSSHLKVNPDIPVSRTSDVYDTAKNILKPRSNVADSYAVAFSYVPWLSDMRQTTDTRVAIMAGHDDPFFPSKALRDNLKPGDADIFATIEGGHGFARRSSRLALAVQLLDELRNLPATKRTEMEVRDLTRP